MPNNKENHQKVPIMKDCYSCGSNYNSRSGAINNKGQMICINCYHQEKESWEERLQKEPIMLMVQILLVALENPIYEQETKQAIKSLKSFISKTLHQAQEDARREGYEKGYMQGQYDFSEGNVSEKL